MSIIKENASPVRQEAANNSKPSNAAPAVSVQHHGIPPQTKVNSIPGYEAASMPGMLPGIVPTAGYVYPQGFDPGAFVFPFNMGQMGFQSPDSQALNQQLSQQMSQNYSHMLPPMMENAKKKPIILDQTQERFNGRLKFFDEAKGYGFIVKDDDEKDIFCHFDDFSKAGITLNLLRSVKLGQTLKLSFSCLSYIGRHNKSKKAVDLQLIGVTTNPTISIAANMGGLVGLAPMGFPGFAPFQLAPLPPGYQM